MYSQYVCSLGIEPTTFAMITQCSTTGIKETARTMGRSEVIYKCVLCSSVYATNEDIRRSKAQNPYNNFYFNKHKCIGNIAHYILNQNMKKINYFFIMLFKNTAVSAFFITKSNIYCIT